MSTNNVTPDVVVTKDLSQILDSRGGSHVTNVPNFDVEDFSSWKDSKSDVEENARSKNEFLADLNAEFQNRALLDNLKRFYKRDKVCNLKKVIEKWTSSKVTLDQLLTEQVPKNIVRALGGKGKRKKTISFKEVVFTKDDESPLEIVLEITSDSESECENQEPLPPIPKLLRAKPIGTSTDIILLVDLTQTSAEHPEQIIVKKTLVKLKAQSSQGSTSRKTPKIPKPFIHCKYCGFNYHHFDECKYYAGCDICGSIAHETVDCVKKSSNNRKPRIANQQSTEPTEKDYLGKFDENADYGYFLGYSLVAKAFRGDEINFNEDRSFLDDEFLVPRSKVSQSSSKNDYFPYVLTYVSLSINNITIPDPVIPIDTPTLQDNNSIDESPEFSLANDHPIHNKRDNFEPADVHCDSFVSQDITINEPISEVKPSPIIISLLAEVFNHPPVPQDKWSREKHIKLVNILKIRPNKLIQALKDDGLIISMHKDLNQFKSNKVWTLVHVPYGKTIIGTNWVFENKMDKNGVVIKNKAMLVDQGFRQEEWINYNEIFVPIARLEAIRIATTCVLWHIRWM
uniref:Retrovirus-related Pol polyprotein from transposon TNT 1-94 n=1 Tax=Tanacetum cinerariifolium TaxID=118510 RepID=A0A6L2MVC2_TANCI|nr:retrovirus-related Pol polyprotein from transposon TNT 1-94 [Tanacetum cinerariifolium]